MKERCFLLASSHCQALVGARLDQSERLGEESKRFLVPSFQVESGSLVVQLVSGQSGGGHLARDFVICMEDIAFSK